MSESQRPLQVFLCHSSGDKPAVKMLYDRLVKDGVDAWLDTEKLIPGQDWQIEIPKAVKKSDIVIVCLSTHSVTKEGFVQKEIKFALDAAEEKPDGTIFIIPARLKICKMPDRINRFQWVDLFLDDGYDKLFKALQIRAEELGIVAKKAPASSNLVPNTIMPNTKQQSPVEVSKPVTAPATSLPPYRNTSANSPSKSLNKSAESSTTFLIALSSLIVGALNLASWFIPIIGCPMSTIGLVLGFVSVKSSYRVMAFLGIILSSMGLIASIINAALGAYMSLNGQGTP